MAVGRQGGEAGGRETGHEKIVTGVDAFILTPLFTHSQCKKNCFHTSRGSLSPLDALSPGALPCSAGG